MPKLSVKLGEGFQFDSNDAITSSWIQSSIDGHDIKQDDGIYIPSLKGKDGPEGGTTVDNHTLIPEGAGVAINPEVVQVIYTMNVWQTQINGRVPYNIPYVTSGGAKIKKTKQSVLNEINFIFNKRDIDPYTSYVVKKNDLLQFVTGGSTASGTGYSYTFTNRAGNTMEDSNRYVDHTTVALFVVESVTPKANGWKGEITDIQLRCLWSANGYYTKGAILS